MSSRSRIGQLSVGAASERHRSPEARISHLARWSLHMTPGQEWSNADRDTFASYVRWIHNHFPEVSDWSTGQYLLKEGPTGANLVEGQLTVAEYSAYLIGAGFKGRRLSQALISLRRCFILSGVTTSEDLFSGERNSMLAMVNRIGKLSILEERAAIEARLKDAKLPILQNMRILLRRRLWNDTSWADDAGLVHKGAYVCIMLGLDFGMRPSNLLRGDYRKYQGIRMRNPHCLRMKELCFVVEAVYGENDETEEKVIMAHEWGEYVLERKSFKPDYAIFRLLSTKTTTRLKDSDKVEAAGKARYLGRRTPEESDHLDALAEWCQMCRSGAEDPVFARYGIKSRRQKFLRSTDVVGPLRSAAIELGMDPQRFSSKSMRVTYASVASAAEVSSDEMTSMGWSKGSKVPHSVYSRAAIVRNTSALSLDDDLGEIERAIRLSSVDAGKGWTRSVEDAQDRTG